MQSDAPARPRKAGAPYADDVRASVAISLLSSFDFHMQGVVKRADWERGTKLLRIPDDDDALWSRMQSLYSSLGDDGIALQNLPQRTRDVGIAMDDSLLSNVLKGLIGGLAAVTEAVEALRELPDRVATAEERAATLEGVVHGLRSRLQASNESLRRRKTLAAFRAVCEPVFGAWREQASAQRELRRKVALKALAPGVSRCFAFWQSVAEAARREQSRLPALMFQIKRSVARRDLGRYFERWRASNARWIRAGMAIVHAWALNTSTALARWKKVADDIWTAKQLREGRRRASDVERPRESPPPRAPSPPAMRGYATGWHQDLALYGTALSHREEIALRSHAQQRTDQSKVEELETRLAFAEAKAQVLERRLQLRERIGQLDRQSGLEPAYLELVVDDDHPHHRSNAVAMPQSGMPRSYSPSPPPQPPPVNSTPSGAPTPYQPVRPSSAAVVTAAATASDAPDASSVPATGPASHDATAPPGAWAGADCVGPPEAGGAAPGSGGQGRWNEQRARTVRLVGVAELYPAPGPRTRTPQVGYCASESPPAPPTSETSNAPCAAPCAATAAAAARSGGAVAVAGQEAAGPAHGQMPAGGLDGTETLYQQAVQKATAMAAPPEESAPAPRLSPPPADKPQPHAAAPRPPTNPRSAPTVAAGASNRPSRPLSRQAHQGQAPIYQHLCSNPIVTAPPRSPSKAAGGARSAAPVPVVTTANIPRLLAASQPMTPHRKAPPRPMSAGNAVVRVDLGKMTGALGLEPGGTPGGRTMVIGDGSGRAGMRTPGRRAGY